MIDKYMLAFDRLKRNNPAFLSALVVNQTKKLDKVKEFLLKHEWMYDCNHCGDFCFYCDYPKNKGHRETCELKQLLELL